MSVLQNGFFRKYRLAITSSNLGLKWMMKLFSNNLRPISTARSFGAVDTNLARHSELATQKTTMNPFATNSCFM